MGHVVARYIFMTLPELAVVTVILAWLSNEKITPRDTRFLIPPTILLPITGAISNGFLMIVLSSVISIIINATIFYRLHKKLDYSVIVCSLITVVFYMMIIQIVTATVLLNTTKINVLYINSIKYTIMGAISNMVMILVFISSADLLKNLRSKMTELYDKYTR